MQRRLQFRQYRSNQPSMQDLVSTQWLADHLGESEIVILDASAHLPGSPRKAAADFASAHIPGARYMALKSIIDHGSEVPSALPTAMQFASHMAQLGVSETARIVLYDDSDIRSAARAWFMCRMHGMRNVAILDGGLGKWRAEARPLESGTPPAQMTPFVANSSASDGMVRSKAQMLANIDNKAEQVVDARGAARFAGDAPEPREGMRAGHIPGSRNLPFTQLINDDGTYKSHDDLRAAFHSAGINLDRPIIATCGSGVTASVLLFALHLLGKKDTAVYDGSWAEWGADGSLPISKGAVA